MKTFYSSKKVRSISVKAQPDDRQGVMPILLSGDWMKVSLKTLK